MLGTQFPYRAFYRAMPKSFRLTSTQRAVLARTAKVDMALVGDKTTLRALLPAAGGRKAMLNSSIKLWKTSGRP